jgi:acetate kinase
MNGSLLILNAGSSSIKFGIYGVSPDSTVPRARYHGQIAGLAHAPHLRVKDSQGRVVHQVDWAAPVSHADALAPLLAWLEAHLGEAGALLGAAHRVVHGGAQYAAPVLIDATVVQDLRALIPLAPLHQPHHLTAIDAIAHLHPNLPQVACFDTSFHQTQPAVATRFAIPRALTQKGIRRYGFHGLSYEYVVDRLGGVRPQGSAGRLVIAHLGSGASLCATLDGRSVATTMGFTALDGIPMGQRCGALDPGVVLYLMQHEGMSADAVSSLLYHDSGLQGVSGISDDMQTLLESPEPAAHDAVELFVYRVAREIGSLAAALGGLDALVFTAGIGENAPAIRAAIVRACAWLGLELDESANLNTTAGRISAPQGSCTAWVVPTDEDEMIARHAVHLLGAATDPRRGSAAIR